MKVKIVAHFGDYAHADLTKPLLVDVEDEQGREWANNGWCVILPQEKKEPEPVIERAVIETPEDHSAEHETAAIARRGRPRRE